MPEFLVSGALLIHLLSKESQSRLSIEAYVVLPTVDFISLATVDAVITGVTKYSMTTNDAVLASTSDVSGREVCDCKDAVIGGGHSPRGQKGQQVGRVTLQVAGATQKEQGDDLEVHPPHGHDSQPELSTCGLAARPRALRREWRVVWLASTRRQKG